MKWLDNWLAHLEEAGRLRRLRRQRRDVRTRLLTAWARLDEARGYVERDRAAERRYIDLLHQQRRLAREKLHDMEDLVRASIQGQSLIQAELTAAQAREALASDFGALDDRP